eukprot:TRINITY_DN2863_c0_g1_i1.p1 TRINITY_DN2863_c0_g1~~TRINITY_DN2863_c0_g1_i1.p1  ORF type:complete len:302 (+),score=76.06 TRINITY_DN2863_c0_g1_i1:288-1193(+)
MRRQGAYGGSGVNQLVAAQMQHIAAQRMQHNSGMNAFPVRPDVPPMDEDQRYASSKPEGHWHWEVGDPNAANMSTLMYKESQGPADTGSGGNLISKGPEGASPFYQGQMPDPKSQQEKLGMKDAKGTEHGQEMETGYQDLSLPQTLEQLEQKFIDEIIKLTKDQNDAEDEEILRHQERTREINLQFQEKLRSMRTQHAKYREDFLRREAQIREQQYQQASMNQLQHNASGPIGRYIENIREHGHGGGLGEGHPGYPAGYDSFRERMPLYGDAGHPLNRNQGYESRASYAGGRMYDSAPRYY